MDVRVEQQCHGYKNGHQLLATSARLARPDQDALDSLSDLSGPLRPGETFDPYLTTYALPSGDYYVLAKTWQDLTAPRAGCVLTRSILVPMSDWEAIEFPASLMALLMPVDKQQDSLSKIVFSPRPVPLPKVDSTRVAALVEALFLENRKSVVLFEETQPILIAERLLTAFWPAIRRIFSICTLALSPRSLGGKPFDLMFAPRSARSRFSHWDGRIVEESSVTEKASRHRWTAVTVRHIFEEDSPSLLSLDALGILRTEQGANESDLRLSLLWNELLEKSESSPTAILGLLDILNSRGKSSPAEILPFRSLVLRGVDLAQRSMLPPETLRFLVTLIGKFPEREPPDEIQNRIREAFSLSTKRDPSAAVSLLIDSSLGNQTHSPVVAAGIGDGLAGLGEGTEILALAASLRPEDGLRLLAYSRSWARALISATKVTPAERWTDFLDNALQYPDSELRARSRQNLAPLLDMPVHAPLLDSILKDGDNNVLLSVVKQISAATHFSIAEFDEPLRRAARGIEGIQGLRRVILESEATSNSDRFLLATIRPNDADIEWLLNEETLDKRRKASLLTATLSTASERDLQSLLQDESLSETIEEELLWALPVTATQLARLLIAGNLPVGRLLNNGCRVLRFVEGNLKSDLTIRMLTLGLSGADPSDDTQLEELLSEAIPPLDVHRLISLATPPNAKRERLGNNIALLNKADSKIRAGVLAEIEGLSDRLIGRRSSITKELIRAWAQLLADSGTINRRAQLNAAGNVLSFALAERDKPVSPLIAVAFPIVYAELGAGHETPGLFSFIFTDWDRCKTARKNIVEAFLHSSWPTIDLINAAAPTGDLGRVLERLLDNRDGESFLSRLRQDVSKLPAKERMLMEKTIGKALTGLRTA